MTDKTVAMQASDLFAAHANFKEQSSSDDDLQDYSQVADANGDVGGGCEDDGSNKRNEYSNQFGYCGTDIVSDAGTLLTTFGEVADSKVITQIVISFTQTEQPTLAITGHNHDNNPHAAQENFDVSSIIPGSTGGIGVPAIFADGGSDSTPISATLTIALEHVDANDADNEHWVGNNRNCRVDAVIEYTGVPTLTTTGWKVDSEVSGDSNSEFDTFAITAHKYFTRN